MSNNSTVFEVATSSPIQLSPIAPSDAGVTAATIALIGALFGLVSSGINLYAAEVGAINNPKTAAENPPAGRPSTLWMSTGIEGVDLEKGDEASIAAGGPFPTVRAYGVAGNFIGESLDTTGHVRRRNGQWNAFPIWPQKDHDREKPEFLFISFPSNHEPVCVVELGLSMSADFHDRSAHGGFNAHTAKSCGQSWYHSGVRRGMATDFDQNYTESWMPCVWLAAEGARSLQLSLPSHSLVANPPVVKAVNRTAQSRHDYFCNTPARVSFMDDTDMSGPEMDARLKTDVKERGALTLEQTLEKSQQTTTLRDPDRLARRATHADVLSTARRHAHGLLAEELCTHGTSWGPDWVNLEEGKFCDMATKTLYPVCNGHVQDDCFDKDRKDVVKNGAVKRSMPYSREVHYG